jgi:oligopeptide/dipeptide ABC transporter ATP-binding protein
MSFFHLTQIIFQNPYSSLNPRKTVRDIVGVALRQRGFKNTQEREAETLRLLKRVGLSERHIDSYPHQFSGGQRQRIGIARSLAMQPQFIVADEPVSALDVSIQAQVVNLMQDLQTQLGVAYLFIAHDLSMVKHISHRIAVMYLGKIMELTDRNALFEEPLHPYTQSLNSAVPLPNPKLERRRRRFILKGEPPSPANPPSGCVFHPRCPIAVEECIKVVPEFRQARPGHLVACHLADEEGSSKIPEGTVLASEID